MTYINDILINYKYIITTDIIRNNSNYLEPTYKIFYFKTLHGVYKYLDDIITLSYWKKHITIFEYEDISYVKTLIAEYDDEYCKTKYYIKILEERDIPNLLFNKIDCISTGSIVFKVIDDGLEVVESKLNYWNKFMCDDPEVLKYLITIHDRFYVDTSVHDILKSNGIYRRKNVDYNMYNIFDVTCKFNNEAILSALVNKISLISEEVLIEEDVYYKYFGYYIVNVDNFESVVW